MIHIPDWVVPKDAAGNDLCPRCKKTTSACACPVNEPPKQQQQRILDIRLEKNARHGKTVTVIRGLPPDEKTLKELSRILKTRTGSGGTFYIKDGTGIIELQGDKRQAAKDLFRDTIHNS